MSSSQFRTFLIIQTKIDQIIYRQWRQLITVMICCDLTCLLNISNLCLNLRTLSNLFPYILGAYSNFLSLCIRDYCTKYTIFPNTKVHIINTFTLHYSRLYDVSEGVKIFSVYQYKCHMKQARMVFIISLIGPYVSLDWNIEHHCRFPHIKVT